MNRTLPEVSVLILARNEVANIGACLSAVFSQECVRPREVIVLDSGSVDGTLEITRRYPVRIEEIPNGTFHHARTRNDAARLACGELLVYLAADALPASKTWLEDLLAPFEDPRVAAVYGRHLPKRGATLERQATLAAVYGEERIIKDKTRKGDLGYRCYHLSTVNAALRRAAWSVTKFPEDVKVFEDIAIGKLLIDAGWKIVYEPRAAVFHSHNHSSDGLLKRYFDLGVTWRRLGMWDATIRASVVRDALRLVAGGNHGRPNANGPSSRSGGLSLTAAKYLGISLGLNERFLPRRFKKKLSAFQLFD